MEGQFPDLEPDQAGLSEEGQGSGVLAGKPLTVTGTSSCSGGCTVVSNRTYTLDVPQYPVYSEKDPGVQSMGTATVTGSLTTSWVYTGDGLAFPPLSETTVGVRCDSIYPGYRYRAGSANPSYTPTYVLSSSSYPDIARFDKAQLAKHPSWSTLTRVSPAQTGKNRAAACKGFHPPPPYSCDEFPYASTAQGGKGAGEKFHVKIS